MNNQLIQHWCFEMLDRMIRNLYPEVSKDQNNSKCYPTASNTVLIRMIFIIFKKIIANLWMELNVCNLIFLCNHLGKAHLKLNSIHTDEKQSQLEFNLHFLKNKINLREEYRNLPCIFKPDHWEKWNTISWSHIHNYLLGLFVLSDRNYKKNFKTFPRG